MRRWQELAIISDSMDLLQPPGCQKILQQIYPAGKSEGQQTRRHNLWFSGNLNPRLLSSRLADFFLTAEFAQQYSLYWHALRIKW